MSDVSTLLYVQSGYISYPPRSSNPTLFTREHWHLLEILNYRIIQIKLTVLCVCEMLAVKTALACHIVWKPLTWTLLLVCTASLCNFLVGLCWTSHDVLSFLLCIFSAALLLCVFFCVLFCVLLSVLSPFFLRRFFAVSEFGFLTIYYILSTIRIKKFLNDWRWNLGRRFHN